MGYGAKMRCVWPRQDINLERAGHVWIVEGAEYRDKDEPEIGEWRVYSIKGVTESNRELFNEALQGEIF